MSLGSQLDRLLPKLSGRERAVLVLRNFKEGKAQDQTIAFNMGNDDNREYNRLIREWMASGGVAASTDVTVVELLAAFKRHAKIYYGPTAWRRLLTNCLASAIGGTSSSRISDLVVAQVSSPT